MAMALGIQSTVSFLAVLLLSCSLFYHANATVYTVGGPAGWTTPSRAKVNYTEWALNTPFKVGDSLEFNYVPKAHNVLEVIRSDFRYCNKTNPILQREDTSGRSVVVLEKPGNYYFIDGVGDHCEEGQKFQARVAPSSANLADFGAPASAPASSPSAIPPATSSADPFPLSFCVLPLTLFFSWLLLA